MLADEGDTESTLWKISLEDLKSIGVFVLEHKPFSKALEKSGKAYIMILNLLKNYYLNEIYINFTKILSLISGK